MARRVGETHIHQPSVAISHCDSPCLSLVGLEAIHVAPQPSRCSIGRANLRPPHPWEALCRPVPAWQAPAPAPYSAEAAPLRDRHASRQRVKAPATKEQQQHTLLLARQCGGPGVAAVAVNRIAASGSHCGSHVAAALTHPPPPHRWSCCSPPRRSAAPSTAAGPPAEATG